MDTAFDIHRIQLISIAGSIIFIILIFELIRKKWIKEEYSILWLFFGFVFIVISLWRSSIDLIAGALGISYAPAALFLLIILSILTILIHYSLVISQLSEKVKTLIQKNALLEMEIVELKKNKKRRQ